MRDNTRLGEKFEVALDGRQIASVVVGALVLLGVVFVLGYNVGRQVGGRSERVPAAGTLAALDEAGQERTTFWDQLPKNRPARPPSGPAPGAPPEAQARPPPEPAAATTSPTPSPAEAQPAPPAPAEAAPPAAALAAASSGAGTPVTASAIGEPPPARPQSAAQPVAARRAERPGTFTVQVGATQSRADADRLAGRFAGRGARVAEGEAAGIGKVWRVRVGSFADRAAATRLAEQLARETGVKGFVTQLP
jgi:DedD protein